MCVCVCVAFADRDVFFSATTSAKLLKNPGVGEVGQECWMDPAPGVHSAGPKSLGGKFSGQLAGRWFLTPGKNIPKPAGFEILHGTSSHKLLKPSKTPVLTTFGTIISPKFTTKICQLGPASCSDLASADSPSGGRGWSTAWLNGWKSRGASEIPVLGVL